jgi:hypothetical protein
MSLRAIVFAALASVAAGTAEAAVINSISRADFAAALAGVTLNGQNFDSFANGTPLVGPQDGVSFSALIGTVIVTDQFFESTSPNAIGSTATEADFNGLRFFTSDNVVTITFANPIIAFAIDINTIAPGAAAYQAAVLTGDTVQSVFDPFPQQQTGQFIGFIASASFTTIVISALIEESFTLDTLVFRVADAGGAVIPIPGAIFLMLTGVGVFGAARARRR